LLSFLRLDVRVLVLAPLAKRRGLKPAGRDPMLAALDADLHGRRGRVLVDILSVFLPRRRAVRKADADSAQSSAIGTFVPHKLGTRARCWVVLAAPR